MHVCMHIYCITQYHQSIILFELLLESKKASCTDNKAAFVRMFLTGLVKMAESLGVRLLPPRKKIIVMIMGNHSAGKSSFINW